MFTNAGMAVSGSNIAGSAQESAYVRDKRHSRHTGTACCDSPAVLGTARFFGLISLVISAFVHLMIMSGLILAIAPAAFDAKLPKNIGLYFAKLSLFLIVSLAL